ncbi:lipid-A-disaccharide synthase [soil metagenome]
MSGPVLYLVSGERSGDAHGAALMREIVATAPGTTFAGLGGPKMRAESGGAVTDWVEEAGVVGLVEVLRKYGYFRERFRAALAAIVSLRPDAVIFIDYPGFNLRLAKALQRAGSTARRIYYISPQVWAWNRGRIPKMARILDLMLCIFPFEKSLYEESGLPTEFVGHPLIQELAAGAPVTGLREPLTLGLFPGSRQREISKHFGPMLGAARVLQAKFPGLQVVASAASERLAGAMRAIAATTGWEPEAWQLEVGKSRDLMARATAGAVASGTATLEAAALGLPHCLVYKVAWPTYLVGRAVMRVDFLGIINVLAGSEIVEELLQRDATAEKIAAALDPLLASPEIRDSLRNRLGETVGTLNQGHGGRRAAEAILASIDPSTSHPIS